MKLPATQEGLSIFIVGRADPGYGLPVAVITKINEYQCLTGQGTFISLMDYYDNNNKYLQSERWCG